jgi:hypothetical protein
VRPVRLQVWSLTRGSSMSEWKWCGDCGHHYAEHKTTEGDRFDVCRHEGCDCTQMYWQDTP